MKTRTFSLFKNWMVCLLALGLLAAGANRGVTAELKLLLPLNRTAYQDNEWIDVSVLHSAFEGLNGELILKLAGEDGSQVQFGFRLGKSEPHGSSGSVVEHLHLNGQFFRPGVYLLEISYGGASARTNISLHSHLRRSDFRLINWGRAKGKEQLFQGEDQLGFNLFYGGYAADEEANFIRAGVDFMANCVMSGGHQMDLRTECDWSDPYVIRGGTRRVARRAFIDRTRPNVPGVHFYDEPGLTWSKDPATGELSPHIVPWQLRSYEAAFGQPALDYRQVDPANTEQAARWAQWARWKLSLMDAAWKDAQFGVSAVEPEYVSVTQSQYGYSAFTDGYYFNVVRSLPIISGHGGYHDFGPGYFNPSMFLEMARARDLARPNWYLPTWFGNATADEFRLEQYLSFQCNLQGMIAPPDLELGSEPEKKKAAQGIVESNHLMGRLGTIFNHIPVTRPPVALLYSLSQFIHTQTVDRAKNYAHDTAHGRNLPFVYLAGKLLQHQFMPVLDEDILDGTLAAQHKAVILTSIDYLDAKVIASLEQFLQQGGLVLLTADCGVQVKGALKLDVTPGWPDAEKIAELKKQGRSKEAGDLTKMRQELEGARKLAEAIRPALEKAGIKPPVTSSEPGIVVTRQVSGDVEYLFAVNATHDPEGNPMLGMKAVPATLGFEADNRPIYDAVHGRLLEKLSRRANRLEKQFRFGPGQMRVFARPSQLIGGVKLAKPVVRRDFLATKPPLRIELAATVINVSGAVPLRIQVTDPAGAIRYDLYRATERGSLNLDLPLALNDPPGEWKVRVTELLSQTWDTNTFSFPPTTTCSGAAGSTWRAVFWPEDREHVFAFFRRHQQITLAIGTTEFNRTAAERLQKVLKPWNVTCSIVNAAEVNRPRPLTEDEARTWIGLEYAGKGQIKPGDTNRPVQAGFALPGPVVLLGTPEDNPLIKFLVEQRFLPYKPSKEAMPGPGRGYVAWQDNGIGVNQESITLIAYDAPGIEEAIGTLYEMLAGMEPLTQFDLAQTSGIQIRRAEDSPPYHARNLPELKQRWMLAVSDRIAGLKTSGKNLKVLTHAGELLEVSGSGKILSQRVLEGSAYAQAEEELRIISDSAALAEMRKRSSLSGLIKYVLTNTDQTAVVYWGGRLELLKGGVPIAARQFQQDITAAAWAGKNLIIGDADGELVCLD